MRYGGQPPDTWLGPRAATSSLAQPPIFGHTIRVLRDFGFDVSSAVVGKARRGLDWLWSHRRTEHGLLYVVHPWEAGNDHSPRWDDWGAPGQTAAGYDRAARTSWNKALMHDLTFTADGAAAWSSRLVACPAGFNAYVAFAMAELARSARRRGAHEQGAQRERRHGPTPLERRRAAVGRPGGRRRRSVRQRADQRRRHGRAGHR